jgi:hypothetical protein
VSWELDSQVPRLWEHAAAAAVFPIGRKDGKFDSDRFCCPGGVYGGILVADAFGFCSRGYARKRWS